MIASYSLLESRWSNRLQGWKNFTAKGAGGCDRPNNLLRVGGGLSGISWGFPRSIGLCGGPGQCGLGQPDRVKGDCPSLEVPRQRNSIAANPGGSQIGGSPASQGRNSLLCLHQGAPLPSLYVASDPIFLVMPALAAPAAGRSATGFPGTICRGTATSAI